MSVVCHWCVCSNNNVVLSVNLKQALSLQFSSRAKGTLNFFILDLVRVLYTTGVCIAGSVGVKIYSSFSSPGSSSKACILYVYVTQRSGLSVVCHW